MEVLADTKQPYSVKGVRPPTVALKDVPGTTSPNVSEEDDKD